MTIGITILAPCIGVQSTIIYRVIQLLVYEVPVEMYKGRVTI